MSVRSIFRSYCKILPNDSLLQAENTMTNLEQIIEKAKKYRMTASEMEEQRQSFAYGNAKIENDRITKAMISKAAAAKGSR